MKEEKDGYEFVSLAAHQMRGPIASIRGYSSMVLDGDYGILPNELFEAVSLIFKAADSLNKTVNDFMDTSKMEQGQMRYYLKDFDLGELIRQTLKENFESLKDGNEIKTHLLAEPVMVHADKMKLKHVLVNLIDNANKYTEKGVIELKLEKKGHGKILLTIKDSGIGIPTEVIPTLFQKFSRATNASKINSAGTGLGLYVVKKMIEAHHGQVWVESEGEGKGSRFYVELPSL